MLKNKIVIILIGFYIFWLGLLPFILSKGAQVLCKNFSHNSDYEIVVEKPKFILSFIPNLNFSAQKILVKSKKEELRIDSDNLKLQLRILPLLSGKLHFNKFLVDKFYFKGEIVDEIELKKELFENNSKLKLKVDKINLKEFQLELFNKDIEKPIVYRGKDFNYHLRNKNVKFVLDSELIIADKKTTTKINLFIPRSNDIDKTKFEVDCSNIDISPFKDYFKQFLPENLKELKGEISVKVNKGELITELLGCAIIMQDANDSIYFPKKTTISSLFNISKNIIKFNDVTVKSDNVSISLNGTLKDYIGKSAPKLDLNIRIDKSKVDEIVKMLPSLRLEEIDIYKLKQYPFYGDVLANFSLKGRFSEPDVVGDIYIDNGVLIKPIPNANKGAIIKINLIGKYLNFDVLVPAGGLEKVWVKGGQELYNMKYADFTIKSTESVDLKIAQNVLNPLHEILNFDLGPVPIMDISGKGNIDISVKGNRKNPRIWGIFNVIDGVASFNDIGAIKANNIKANLVFDDQKAIFTSKEAVLNGQKLSLNGVCDLLGKFDFDVVSKNQQTLFLYKAIRDSKFISENKIQIPKLDTISGLVDFNLKVYGNLKNINDLKINENVFAKGHIELKNNNFVQNNVSINNVNGIVKLAGFDLDTDITAYSDNLPLNIKAKIRNKLANVEVDIPKLNLNSFVSDIPTRAKQYLPNVSLKGEYKNGTIDKIDFSKLNLKAITLPSNANSRVKYNQGGVIIVANNNASIKKIKGFVGDENNSFSLDLNIDNLLEETMNANGVMKLTTPDVSLFNEIIESDILPVAIKNCLKDYHFEKGALNLNARISNNKLGVYSDLGGIILKYLPMDLPVEVINGGFSIRNNTLKLNKLNILADKMPLLIDGDVKKLFEKQDFNIYINSKPQQEFIDKYINKHQIYPIKMRGDIVYWVKLKGEPDNMDVKAKLNMNKNSSLYYFGATIGDIENAIEVSLDSKILPENNHKIKEFSFDKIIESQSGRQTKLNMLKAIGGVKILDEDLAFDNLSIKTNHPTDARIFNIIFRKPNIKQGQFTSDLKLNGKMSDAKILGNFYIFETNIPFLDTTMKSLELIFNDKNIIFASKGEVMGNEILFDGILKNKLTIPYRIEKATLQTKNLDLNRIVNKLKTVQVENDSTFESFESFDVNSIVADNFKLKADSVQLRNINATNFEALTSLSDKSVFNVNDFRFNIAQGTLGGKYSYNFKNNDMSIELKADSINANDITMALFDLNNQIYGDLTGDISLTCNGADFNHCMQSLTGTTVFNVKDGRMPKLGSLEYLLKAGNLVKGGLTGLSINSVVDLIAPSNIGEFSEIFGTVRIKDGMARNIEIATRGNSLNLYLYGTYNFATSIADMKVLGLLSKKMSTMFGAIGNVSINTLFNLIPGVDLSKDSVVLERINKIPGIEISSKAYRKFIAEIKGNIDGDDYVTSFKWIN